MERGGVVARRSGRKRECGWCCLEGMLCFVNGVLGRLERGRKGNERGVNKGCGWCCLKVVVLWW